MADRARRAVPRRSRWAVDLGKVVDVVQAATLDVAHGTGVTRLASRDVPDTKGGAAMIGNEQLANRRRWQGEVRSIQPVVVAGAASPDGLFYSRTTRR